MGFLYNKDWEKEGRYEVRMPDFWFLEDQSPNGLRHRASGRRGHQRMDPLPAKDSFLYAFTTMIVAEEVDSPPSVPSGYEYHVSHKLPSGESRFNRVFSKTERVVDMKAYIVGRDPVHGPTGPPVKMEIYTSIDEGKFPKFLVEPYFRILCREHKAIVQVVLDKFGERPHVLCAETFRGEKQLHLFLKVEEYDKMDV